MSHPLDRPVWSALAGRQAARAEGGPLARRFAPRFSPLAAVSESSRAAARALFALDLSGEGILLLEPDPPPPEPGVLELFRGAGVQMVLGDLAGGGPRPAARRLGPKDVPMMRALAAEARPGPFASHTHELGGFLGIFEGERLVAMAGERLRPEGFCEVSGVCTDPGHRGRGLAGALTRLVAEGISDRGEIPFLHAHADNAAAISLYLSLGFRPRLQLLAVAYGAAAPGTSS